MTKTTISLFGQIFFCTIIGASIQSIAAPNLECSAYPKLKRQIFQTALSNMLSLDYIRHAIEAERNEGVLFCSQAIILGSNAYKYGLFYIQISVVNAHTGRELRNFNFLYQDASTQANHNTRFLNWVGLSAVDAKEKFGQLVQSSTFTKTNLTGPVGETEESELAMIENIKKSKLFNVQNDDEMTLSSIKISERLYLFTWLNKSENSFAHSQLINSVMIQVDASGQYEISPNKFLYSELRIPLNNAVTKAESKIIKGSNVSRYLTKISPAVLSVLSESDLLPLDVVKRTTQIFSKGRKGSGIYLGEGAYRGTNGQMTKGYLAVTNFHVAGDWVDNTNGDLAIINGMKVKIVEKRCHAYRDLCLLILDGIDVLKNPSIPKQFLKIVPTNSLKKNDLLFFSGWVLKLPLWSYGLVSNLFDFQDSVIGQTDSQVFVQGMSGGFVMNKFGDLVGVISFITRKSDSSSSGHFFLPTEWIQDLIFASSSDYSVKQPFYYRDEENLELFPNFLKAFLSVP